MDETLRCHFRLDDEGCDNLYNAVEVYEVTCVVNVITSCSVTLESGKEVY